jgi:hypothetical protein
MKAAAAAFETSAEACPPANDLLAHYRGELDPALRERMESHLIACPACRERLRDVADFFEPIREDEEALPVVDPESEWNRLWLRVEGASGATKKQPVPIRSSTPRWMMAMAACLVIGLSLTVVWALGWRGQLRQIEAENRRLRQESERDQQQIAQLRAPRANVSIHDVFSADSISRSAGAGTVNRVAVPGGAAFTLILNGEGVRNLPEYAIEIMDGQGRSVWKAQGLKRGALGNFALTFDSSFLAPGEYRLRLAGKTNAGYEPLTEYRVAISRLP